jgi:TonB family protein
MPEAPPMPPDLQTPEKPEPMILPTLFGEGYGNYNARPAAFVFGYAINLFALAAVLLVSQWILEHRQEIKQQVTSLVTDISPYVLKSAAKESGGGGGGGDRDKLQASKGPLPKQAREQITPPRVVPAEEPKLPVAPTVVAPVLQPPMLGNLGDPMSKILGPPSSGTGSGGGIGSGSGGGVGSGTGPGVGPGIGGGVGGGYYRVGGGVSAPRALYAPDPEYSEEARKAKYQGTVVLWVVVGPDGRPRDIRVARSLGLGLDEKAIDAVRQWKFDPARKDGSPVAVQINVEVNFRLY